MMMVVLVGLEVLVVAIILKYSSVPFMLLALEICSKCLNVS